MARSENPYAINDVEFRMEEILEPVEPKSFVTGVSKVAVTES